MRETYEEGGACAGRAHMGKPITALFRPAPLFEVPTPLRPPASPRRAHFFPGDDVLDRPDHKRAALPGHHRVGGVIIGVVYQVEQGQQDPADDVGVVRQKEGVGGDLGAGWAGGAEEGGAEGGGVRT